jgi:hypothetical protein
LIPAALLATVQSELGQSIEITTQPANTAVYVDENARLTVAAAGAPAVAFQWRFGDTDLPNQTNSALNLLKVNFTDAGAYSVVLSNQAGFTTSQTAWLSVLPTNVVNLGNRELRFGELSAPIWEAARKDDDGANITPDGLTIFYASTASGGSGSLDLWMVKRPSLSAPWGTPVNLGPTVNSAAVENEPFLSPDGLSLYFDSNRPGGHGGFDLWVTTRAALDAPFGPPVNLGPAINSSDDEAEVLVSADNRTLVFSSNRPGRLGDQDIYMSTRTDALAPWEPARHLPAPINYSTGGTFPVVLSRDALTLFFKSWRPTPPGFPEPAAVYVCSRPSTSSSFGTPVLIRAILGIGTGGSGYCTLSDDGATLYVGTYRTLYPDWPQIVQLSLSSVPQLKALGRNAAGDFQLELSGREGASYQLESSPDLKSWTPWLTTNTPGTARLSVPTSGKPAGFYRASGY